MSPGRFMFALLALLPLLGAGSARAHGVNLFATLQGTTILGELTYADGTPAPSAPISAFAPDGALIGEAITDSAGKFSMEARYRCRHRLAGDAGQGHRAYFTIPEADFPESLPRLGEVTSTTPAPVEAAPPPSMGAEPNAADFDARIEEAVARQVRPLREQINRMETQVRFRDVLGGVGYLFGVAGLFVLIRGRKSGVGG